MSETIVLNNSDANPVLHTNGVANNDKHHKTINVDLILFSSLSLISHTILITCIVISFNYKREPFVTSEDPLYLFPIISLILLAINFVFSIIVFPFKLKNKHQIIKKATISFIALLLTCLLMFIVALYPLLIQFLLSRSNENYRQIFFQHMESYDKNPKDNATDWLNKIQHKYRCCGYNSKKDYKEYFKPASCCDDTKNDTQSLFSCRNPPLDIEGRMNIQFDYYNYYDQGCAKIVNQIINRANEIFFSCGFTLCLLMIIVYFLKHLYLIYESKNEKKSSI